MKYIYRKEDLLNKFDEVGLLYRFTGAISK